MAALVSLATVGAIAQELELREFRADELRVVYLTESNEYILPHLSRCFLNSLGFYEALFGYTPSEEVTVLLQDFDDYGYAGATVMPVNYLTIGIEPFEYVYETSPTNERINWVMSHELLHVVAADKAAPADERARWFFGGKVAAEPEQPLSMLYSYLTTPRLYAPRWYHEGMAVFMETWMAGGYGRALGGYDELVFRTMVADGAHFYDTVGLESEGKAIDFQVGQVSYLYGTRFVSYLANQYGPETLLQWLSRGPGTRASYRAQFRQVYGTDLDSEWRRWIEWEHEWQQSNLDLIKEYPLTEFEPVSQRPLGSVSRAYFDPERRKLITAVNYPGEFAHVAAIDVDSWEVDKIIEIPTPALYYVTALAYDPDSGTVFYTTDNSRQWRDLNSVEVDTGVHTVLLKDIRTGDLAFNRADRSVWGVQHHNGMSTVVRIAPPYRSWEDLTQVLTLEFGKDLFDIDLSPDGVWLTGSLIEVSGRQRLIRMRVDDLMNQYTDYEVLHEFAKNSPANFVYSEDGRYLYGTSYFTGASNVFRFDLERKEMEALTNAATGFFRPVPIDDDEIMAFHYTSRGFVPVRLDVQPIDDINPARFLGQEIVENHPLVKEWMLPPPSAVDLESMETESRPYRPVAEMGLSSWYPIVEAYRGHPAIGARFNLMDPVGLANLNVTASVTPEEEVPNDEKVHATANFNRWPWRLSGYYNPADFYDFFGPTESSRKGYGAVGEYKGVLIASSPRSLDYSFTLSGFGGLDTLPEYQNVPATYKEYLNASASLDYASYRKTIGGLGPEKGVAWGIWANDRYAQSDHFARLWGDLSLGFTLPLNHSSIWIRPGAGYSWGDRDNTLSNFYFGGFGNNWVDHQNERRFREYYAFPGLELNELEAGNYAKLLVEWTLPPLRFQRAGWPNFYVTWMSPVLFATGIATDLDSAGLRREVYDAGAQIDFKVVLFSNLSATISLGYARALEDGGSAGDEVMVSLKIL